MGSFPETLNDPTSLVSKKQYSTTEIMACEHRRISGCRFSPPKRQPEVCLCLQATEINDIQLKIKGTQ